VGLIPGRKQSKKQKAVKAAGKAGKTVVKAKAVQKAPKTAAAVWTGKRSGKIVKGVGAAVLALVTFRVVRSKLGGKSDSTGGAPANATPFPTTTPTPDPGAPGASGAALNGSAPQPDPAAPYAPPLAASPTPPHGDKGEDVLEDKPEDEQS
jgi:hypothetical protein